MSATPIRLAEACERAARYASFVEAMSDDMEQRITARNDVAEYRALAAALRGAERTGCYVEAEDGEPYADEYTIFLPGDA